MKRGETGQKQDKVQTHTSSFFVFFVIFPVRSVMTHHDLGCPCGRRGPVGRGSESFDEKSPVMSDDPGSVWADAARLNGNKLHSDNYA